MTYPYDKYTVFEYPQSCSSCPVGFMKGGKCGRNIPFTDVDYKQRPSTCKLKKLDHQEIQRIIDQAIKFYLYDSK